MVKNSRTLQNNSKKKKSNLSKILALITLLIYVLLYFANEKFFTLSFNSLLNMIVKIGPYLIIIFLLMLFNELIISPESIKKFLGKNSGWKGLLATSVFGIISVGPVYVWFPLLNDLKKHGLTDKLIAIFMYNRAVKLQVLPVMILYFGVRYSVIFTLFIIFASFFIGVIVEYFVKENQSHID
jgi:uncharacterized membrane protein YraQ (UPF0718 family)